MSTRTIINSSAVFAAAAALGTAGLLASPAAHAETCTANGTFFVIHQENGVDITVVSNGSKLGPNARSTRGNDLGPSGSMSGAITGRNIDFSITWYTNQVGLQGDPGTAHFTGTIGDNVATGTSTGAAYNVARQDGVTTFWAPGPWSSVGFPFTCADDKPAADQKPTAIVNSDVDVYNAKNEPDGAGQVVGILGSGSSVELLGPCQKDSWCNVSGDAVPGGSGWVWGALNL